MKPNPRCVVITLQSDLSEAEAKAVWNAISMTKGVALLTDIIRPDEAKFETVKLLFHENSPRQ